MRDAPYPDQLSFIDIGWLAGLFEGEGCASLSVTQNERGWTRRNICVSICMTDRDVIERVNALFPSGHAIKERRRLKNKAGDAYHKTQYVWSISRREQVARFLRMVLPLLGDRRRVQALKVLEVAENPAYGLGSGMRNKTHCQNGHEYTPENTRANSGKGCLRRCKICERNYNKRRPQPAASAIS